MCLVTGMKDYRQGFGDVFGEYWIGLETLRTFSGARISNTLNIVLEDWDGNIRTATYNKFYVYGQGYSIQVSILTIRYLLNSISRHLRNKKFR